MNQDILLKITPQTITLFHSAHGQDNFTPYIEDGTADQPLDVWFDTQSIPDQQLPNALTLVSKDVIRNYMTANDLGNLEAWKPTMSLLLEFDQEVPQTVADATLQQLLTDGFGTVNMYKPSLKESASTSHASNKSLDSDLADLSEFSDFAKTGTDQPSAPVESSESPTSDESTTPAVGSHPVTTTHTDVDTEDSQDIESEEEDEESVPSVDKTKKGSSSSVNNWRQHYNADDTDKIGAKSGGSMKWVAIVAAVAVIAAATYFLIPRGTVADDPNDNINPEAVVNTPVENTDTAEEVAEVVEEAEPSTPTVPEAHSTPSSSKTTTTSKKPVLGGAATYDPNTDVITFNRPYQLDLKNGGEVLEIPAGASISHPVMSGGFLKGGRLKIGDEVRTITSIKAKL